MGSPEPRDVSTLLASFRDARPTVQRSQQVEAQATKILELYSENPMAVRQLHKMTGIPPTNIYRILHQAGITPNASHAGGVTRIFSDEVEAKIAEEYQQGQSMVALTVQYDVCRATIKHILQRQGVSLRPRGIMRKEISEEFAKALFACWQSGMSQRAIAQKYGMTQARICGILKRFHVGTKDRIARRERLPHWKGGRRHHQGYVLVLLENDHPFYAAMAVSTGYVFEHRLMMAEALGRPLTEHESVHHIDGKRDHNVLSNLQLRQGKHGPGVIYHCADCGSINVIGQAIASSAEEAAPHSVGSQPALQGDCQSKEEPQQQYQPHFELPQLALDLAIS